MVRKGWLVVLVGLAFASLASAQATTGRFRWQTGQALTYRVEQITTASETTGDKKAESKTQMNLLKRWQVQNVDADGVAILQLSLAALRLETTTAAGDVLLFDSSNPDKSDPQMREQLSAYVGPPLAVLRMDSQGRVIEVKESKHGPASRFEAELPFAIVLPEASLRVGQSWERAYKITLEPPQGTGEKYDAVQQYTCKALTKEAATITLTTTLKAMPDSLLDRVPLLQLQPQGEVVFDVQSGLMRRARLEINKELKGHQGEGSSYRLTSTYMEEYVAK